MRNNKPLHTSVIERIVDAYAQGIGTQQIATDEDISPSVVQKYVRRAGLLKPKQKYSHNRDFFSTYSHESAYWAGFIMADGYIRASKHLIGIHLQERDKGHLKKFLAALSSNHELLYDKSTQAWCAQIYSKDLKRGLVEKYAVTPKKSKITIFPQDLPKECYADFIRGLVDGDGSITFTTVPAFSLVGARDLITEVNDILSQQSKHTPTITTPNKDKDWFVSISFSGRNANQVLDWLYATSTPATRLDRKYQKYLDLFISPRSP